MADLENMTAEEKKGYHLAMAEKSTAKPLRIRDIRGMTTRELIDSGRLEEAKKVMAAGPVEGENDDIDTEDDE
jgi:hypothetical protein